MGCEEQPCIGKERQAQKINLAIDRIRVDVNRRYQELKQDYESYKAQEDMNLFFGAFPNLSEHLRTVQLSKGIGLTVDVIKKLFNGEIVPVTGKLHSPEHDPDFSVQDATLQLFREQDNPDRFCLFLNGQNILDRFKQKYQQLKQVIRPHIKPPEKPEVGKNKGLRGNRGCFSKIQYLWQM